jgi:hypothetical protein
MLSSVKSRCVARLRTPGESSSRTDAVLHATVNVRAFPAAMSIQRFSAWRTSSSLLTPSGLTA